MTTRDVIIIGGGPAGSTVASVLALGGVQALVLERDTFPRFHIGESMLPQSMKVWDRIGITRELRAAFLPKYGARFLCCTTGRQQTYEFDEAFDASVTHAFQVPRAEFDHLLLRHAAGLGAEVRHGWEVLAPIVEDGFVRGLRARSPDGVTHELRARVVVDATGRDAFLAGRMAKKQRLPLLDKTALYTHWRGAERRPGREEGHIDIIVFPEGWFWNIPFKDGVNSMGFVCSSGWIKERGAGESLDAFYDRTVAGASWAARILARAERLAPVRAAADYSYRIDRYGGDGWVLVGDASGFIDPLFSTGAHLAFGGGALAADAILAALARGGELGAETWTAYEAKARAAGELFAGAVQAFYTGPLPSLIFEEPQRPVLRKTISSMLAGDVFGDDAAWRRFLRAQYPVLLADG